MLDFTWIGGPVLALLIIDFCDPLFPCGKYLLTFWQKNVIPCGFFAYTGFSGGTNNNANF
jgi:hypothetical protein